MFACVSVLSGTKILLRNLRPMFAMWSMMSSCFKFTSFETHTDGTYSRPSSCTMPILPRELCTMLTVLNDDFCTSLSCSKSCLSSWDVGRFSLLKLRNISISTVLFFQRSQQAASRSVPAREGMCVLRLDNVHTFHIDTKHSTTWSQRAPSQL